MSDPAPLKLSKWPFVLGDLLMLAAACVLHARGLNSLWETGLLVLAVAAGAFLLILPFVLEYKAAVRLSEALSLSSVLPQLKALQDVNASIGAATGRWNNIQEECDKTVKGAGELAQRMAAEAKSFSEFMQRMNDSEKAALRLETEKLKRAENDWLQVILRTLDHVYALYLGGLRSGQPNLIDQLTQFQNACRDAARRVGLVPFIALENEAFNSERHQVVDGELEPQTGSVVRHTVATGYTFQGRLLRPALVRLAPKAQDSASPGR